MERVRENDEFHYLADPSGTGMGKRREDYSHSSWTILSILPIPDTLYYEQTDHGSFFF